MMFTCNRRFIKLEMEVLKLQGQIRNNQEALVKITDFLRSLDIKRNQQGKPVKMNPVERVIRNILKESSQKSQIADPAKAEHPSKS